MRNCRVQILTHNFIEILSLDFGVWLKEKGGWCRPFRLSDKKQRVAKTTLFQKGKHLASLTPFFRLNQFLFPFVPFLFPQGTRTLGTPVFTGFFSRGRGNRTLNENAKTLVFTEVSAPSLCSLCSIGNKLVRDCPTYLFFLFIFPASTKIVEFSCCCYVTMTHHFHHNAIIYIGVN